MQISQTIAEFLQCNGGKLEEAEDFKFINPRRSRRDIVLASSVRPSVCPSVRPFRPSVRIHISVPIGQI